MIIANNEIKPGEHKIIKLYAGRLPSDTQIPIHIHIYRSNEPGPTLLLVGGMHGDEINGVEILRKSIQKRLFENLKKGTVIVIPLLNVYGFINFSRDLPDGKDVNRSFPGSSRGSLARRVAYKLTHEILDQVDFGIDFHTGGNSRYNYPQIRYTNDDTKAFELAKAFSPPVIIEKSMITGSLRAASKKRDIPFIVYEGGEALRWDQHALEEGMNGLERLMKHFEMIDEAVKKSTASIIISKTTWIRAQKSGLFTWYKSSGESVEKDCILGVITDTIGNKVHQVKSKSKGLIIGHNNAAVVHTGDALFNIGIVQKP